MPYEEMEEVLKFINKIYVSNKKDGKITNEELNQTLVKLTEHMREDNLFEELFNGFSFGGSSYKKLKVKGPKQFDIDFILVLPDCNECQVKNCSCVSVKPSSNYPGYFLFNIQESCCPSVYHKFCHNGRMQTDLVFNWMKSLIYKGLNRMSRKNTITTFEEENTTEEKWIFATERKPSLTIRVNAEFGSILINITAAFKIGPKYWPSTTTGFTENSTNQEHFLIVPASPDGLNSCWRPHFQAQEKEILKKKERLKPALRLLKLMRSNLNHRISSYMLETLALEDADQYEWTEKSLSETFMILLKQYVSYIGQSPPRIRYYWFREVNLLEGINIDTLINHHNEIRRLYNRIEREYKTNPTVVAEVILKKESDDYNEFMEHWECPEPVRGFPFIFVNDLDDSDDDDSTCYSVQTTNFNGGAAAATVVGVVGAVAIGALLYNAFSNRSQRPRD